jgi:hypothetical protein
MLLLEDGIDEGLDPGLKRLIVEQVGEGNDSVEPVGNALPALGVATDPGTALDIGPELIEMPAESGGLRLELLTKLA